MVINGLGLPVVIALTLAALVSGALLGAWLTSWWAGRPVTDYPPPPPDDPDRVEIYAARHGWVRT